MGILPHHFLVGTACFIRSWKGIEDFLKAADLLRSIPDIRWVIIGGGHAEKYIQKAQELQLEGLVHFSGHLENPFPALGALDLFTLLSTAHEGVSQAILQAAYLRKPLIATNIGGLDEVCLDRVTGLQVKPFSPHEVAKAVLELKQNESLRQKLGEGAQSLVKEKFTIDLTINQMEQVYKNLSL
jgi:glycosyltransferase involved in cell wall biosynthesis